jgi:hypothetical protein
MKKLLTPSPAMVVACIALFVAMGGTGYAATQLGNRDGNMASISKKHKAKRGPRGKAGPAGPQGPAGPSGPAGAAGTARAYARVAANGTIDPATSKNVISVSTAGGSLLCFKLGFTPSSVIATIEGYSSDQPSPISPPYGTVVSGIGKGTSVCPAGTDAYTATANATGTGERLPVFVVFN